MHANSTSLPIPCHSLLRVEAHSFVRMQEHYRCLVVAHDCPHSSQKSRACHHDAYSFVSSCQIGFQSVDAPFVSC